jgi:Fe-S cluster biosynthesis and repair protein YggX
MDSKYNSQKSNGETFQRIVKEGDKLGDKLIGILEERVNIMDGTDRFYLYQELTDYYNGQVEYRVRREPFPEGSFTISEDDIDKI